MCLKAPSTTLRGKRQCTPKNRSVNKHACARCAISHVKCDMDEPFSLAMCCRCSNLRLICPGHMSRAEAKTWADGQQNAKNGAIVGSGQPQNAETNPSLEFVMEEPGA